MAHERPLVLTKHDGSWLFVVAAEETPPGEQLSRLHEEAMERYSLLSLSRGDTVATVHIEDGHVEDVEWHDDPG